jgi:hypothetical protein
LSQLVPIVKNDGWGEEGEYSHREANMSESRGESVIQTPIRVYVDHDELQSANPTTGTALYVLARVPEGEELFREGKEDHEDQLIAKDNRELHLKPEEHFHRGKERKYKIIVNLESKVVNKKVLAFRDVVKLAYPNVQDGPDVVYTVTFKRAARPQREGTLKEGQSVEIKNGTIFSVTRTDKS